MAILDFLAGVFEPLPRFIGSVWGTVTGHSAMGAVLVVTGLSVLATGATLYERMRRRSRGR